MSLLPQLFLECVRKGTLVPFATDTTFFAMKSFGNYDMTWPLILAPLGATIGQCINWCIGKFINRYKDKPELRLNGIWFDRLQKAFNGYFFFLLLFTWVPLCTLITLASGMFGTRLKVVLPLIFIGQLGYYYYSLTH